jgi:hypothetical protein
MIYFLILQFLFQSCRPNVTVLPFKYVHVSSEQTHTEVISFGDSRCSFGGVKVSSWTDEEVVDGIYTRPLALLNHQLEISNFKS